VIAYKPAKAAFSTFAYSYIRDEMRKELPSVQCLPIDISLTPIAGPDSAHIYLEGPEPDPSNPITDYKTFYLSDFVPDGNIDILGSAIAGERGRNVRYAVCQLRHDLRRVIYLRYFKDLTLEKTGAILGITGSAVQQREVKAKKLLKRSLTRSMN